MIRRDSGKQKVISGADAADSEINTSAEVEPVTDYGQGGWASCVSRKDLMACLEHAPCGVVIHRTRLGKILHINRAAHELTGYDVRDLPTGRMAGLSFAPNLAERLDLREKMRDIALSNRKSAIVKIVCKSGEMKIVEVRVATLSKRMMVSMWVDVTRREEAEQALSESKRELENKVHERTSELVSLNKQLREEVKTRRNTETALEKSREELRYLSEHLQRTREEEKTRIAREVHDELSQSLSTVKIDIARLGQCLPKGSLKEEVVVIEQQLTGIIEAARNICTELRPPGFDPSGLPAAIEWHVAKFEKRTGIHCTVRIGSGIRFRGQDLPLVIFRILQEALANVAYHAGATALYIGLVQNRRNLVLTVRDNGRGISKEDISKPGSYGIIGMRERIRFWGGKLRFTFSLGRGATLTASIPSDQTKDRLMRGLPRTQ